MAEPSRVEGIVTGRQKKGEADLLIHVLCNDGQELPLQIFGLQKSVKRPLQLAEPGAHIAAEIWTDEKGFHSLKEGTVLRTLQSRAYADLLIVSYLLECAGRMAQASPDAACFVLLQGALNAYDAAPGSHTATLLLPFFLVRLLGYAGLLGPVENCASCQNPLQGKVFWAVPEYSLYCEACDARASLEDHQAVLFANRSLQSKFSSLQRGPQWSDAVLQSMTLKWHLSLEHYLGRPLRSASLLLNGLSGTRTSGPSAHVGAGSGVQAGLP